MGSESPPRFLLSIFIMLVSPEQLQLQVARDAALGPSARIACSEVETCALSFWLVRAARLGAVLESATGRDVAIDAFTPCIEPGVRESASRVTVRVHERFPPELEATVPFVPIDEHPNGGARKPYLLWVTLLKWVAVSLDSEFVVCFDLDMDVFLPMLEPIVDAVAREWLDAFERMKRIKASLASLPDHSAPINAGFMLLRPNRTLYDEGVALLGRANTSFSEARGWELLGEPLAVVPLADAMGWQDARNQRRSTLGWIRTQKKWTFVGAPLDQGFFFHMYRIRRQWPYGIDVNCLPPVPARAERAPSAEPAASPAPARAAGAYSLVHMFNKPFKSTMCRWNLKRLGPESKSTRYYLSKVIAWHASAHHLFSQQAATDRALVRTEGVERMCAARSLKEVTCARAVEERRAQARNVTYVPQNYTLSKVYSAFRIFTYSPAASCPPLVAPLSDKAKTKSRRRKGLRDDDRGANSSSDGPRESPA